MRGIQFDQSLVETAVFLAAREDEKIECELHLALDPVYEIRDEERRQEEFVALFRDFFTRLKLDRPVTDRIAERPLVGRRIERFIVHEAMRKRAELAELFVEDAGQAAGATRTLVIQACGESLVHAESFTSRMRRELLHISDMLDLRFGYDPASLAEGTFPRSLIQDRYRVLWDVYVEGRLKREGWGDKQEEARLRKGFARVFAHASPHARDAVFHHLLHARKITHAQLFDWTQQPERLFQWPGTPCKVERTSCGPLPDPLVETSCGS